MIKLSEHKKTPIWLMRQAGRYMSEYQNIRKNFPDFMSMCLNPEVATEITLQPIKKFNFDAAIIFSDILMIPHMLGFDVKFDGGPVVQKISSEKDLDKFQVEKISEKFFPLRELILSVRNELLNLHSKKTLIGFSGAPWTLFCYMINKRIDKNFVNNRKFIYQQPKFFEKIIEKLTEMIYFYLSLQIKSGIDTVKIFDSWAGELSWDEFELFCLQPIKKIVHKLKKNYPQVEIVCFPKGINCSMAERFASEVELDIFATSVNHSLSDLQKLQKKVVIQSNLDPLLLAFDIEKALQKTEEIMQKLQKPFVFNLGHGVHKETPPENVQKIVDLVRKLS